MVNKFIDVASYQPASLGYFRVVKKLGIKGVVVKLTEGSTQGTNYVNPRASLQIEHAKEVGLTVSVYHFLRSISVSDAQQEAQFFAAQVKKNGLTGQVLCVVDVEADDLTHNREALTKQVNAFTAELRVLGYPKSAIYSSTSWYTGRLIQSQLQTKTWWVASYGTQSAGIPCTAWQYSSNQMIQGTPTDISVDYSGAFTDKNNSSGIIKPIKVPISWVDSLGVRWHPEKGTFTSTQAIFLRWGATASSTQISLLPTGSVVKYDAFAHSGGYIWLRQPRGKGQYGYLASGESKNGRRISSWGKFK